MTTDPRKLTDRRSEQYPDQPNDYPQHVVHDVEQLPAELESTSL